MYEVTRAHAVACGVPAHLADEAVAQGISFAQLVMLLAKYGNMLWPIIQADRAAGKSWPQIVADLFAAVAMPAS